LIDLDTRPLAPKAMLAARSGTPAVSADMLVAT
jgi:hypothetical protein